VLNDDDMNDGRTVTVVCMAPLPLAPPPPLRGVRRSMLRADRCPSLPSPSSTFESLDRDVRAAASCTASLARVAAAAARADVGAALSSPPPSCVEGVEGAAVGRAVTFAGLLPCRPSSGCRAPSRRRDTPAELLGRPSARDVDNEV
jgi:hypothetical protein